MQEKSTEFTQKIQNYSKSTLEKIIGTMTTLQNFKIIRKIVMESKTEQEVLEKINNKDVIQP